MSSASSRSGISLKHRLEYVLIRLLSLPALILPHRIALVPGWLVAAFLFHVVRFRRTETLQRIQAVFGEEMTEARAEHIAWISLRNLAFNAVEMFRVRRFTIDDLREIIPGMDEIVAELNCKARAGEGTGGAILAIPHMGNWDLAGSACLLAGSPIFSVAARQRNLLVNSYIQELRGGHGMQILERGAGMLRQVVQRLKDGEFFAILPDTRSRQPGVEVEFLGGTANLARGMAAFARRAGVPILPVIMQRQGWRHFSVQLAEAVWPDPEAEKEADLQRMTRAVMEPIERAIRVAPEQWFWYNRRWVLDPL